MIWGELYGPFLSSGISLEEVRRMTLAEIDRQYAHWAIFPPPVIQLHRIGAALGISLPERADSAPIRPSSEDELAAVAAQFGVLRGG